MRAQSRYLHTETLPSTAFSLIDVCCQFVEFFKECFDLMRHPSPDIVHATLEELGNVHFSCHERLLTSLKEYEARRQSLVGDSKIGAKGDSKDKTHTYNMVSSYKLYFSEPVLELVARLYDNLSAQNFFSMAPVVKKTLIDSVQVNSFFQLFVSN